MTFFVRLLRHLPLQVRLLATASFALFVAGSSMLFLSVREEGQQARDDLHRELAADLEMLPAALSEVVVLGDYASLQQTLDRYVHQPQILKASFKDSAGVLLQSTSPEQPSKAPHWFLEMQNFENLPGSSEIIIGGRQYGTLELTLSPLEAADRSWARLTSHLAVLFLAVVLDFCGIWGVLCLSLRPLQALEEGARGLAEGRLDHRLADRGSPELRRVIAAFNQMADGLQGTQTQLLRRNQELTRFSEITAHHLQEPTRRLMIFSQKLQSALRENKSETVQTSLSFIVQEAARLRNLLRDIEFFLAAPRPLGQIEDQETTAVLNDVMNSLQAGLDSAQAQIEVFPLASVRLDQRRLSTIFTIALTNALHYRRPGIPLRLRISSQVRGDFVRLSIADNGCGISEQYRERVFRVFERLDPQPEDTSTGVGLSVVRRIAEALGGTAWIEDGLPDARNEPPRPPEGPTRGITLSFDLPKGEHG